MAPPVLQIGTLDVSPYLDLTPEGAMNPAAPEFSERIFSHSLLKEGGVLALENLKVKEMIFPLFLKAASKDALDALVAQVNNAMGVPGQTVSWQDTGASNPTVFDLASGQVDPEYHYWRGAKNYLRAKLRLFVQPFGRLPGPPVLAASAAGTGPVLVFSGAQPVGGDAPAQIQAVVSRGGATAAASAGAVARFMAVSALPGPSYLPEARATSFTAVQAGTLIGASGAVASQTLRSYIAPSANMGRFLGLFKVPLLIPSVYAGDNRAFVLVKASAVGASVSIAHQDWWASRGPAASLPLNLDWQLVDLGVLRVGSALPGPSGAAMQIGAVGLNGAATMTVDVTDVILLPEARTTFVRDNNLNADGVDAYRAFTFDGIANEVSSAASGQPLGYRLTPTVRGQIPPAAAGSVPIFAALSMMTTPAGTYTGSTPCNDTISASVSVRSRFRFAA